MGWPGNIRELENFIERAVIVTRGKSLDAPLGELRKTNTVELPRAHDRKLERVVEERTDSQSDQTSVADEYERRQCDEIIRALTACKGRVGGADGAAAPGNEPHHFPFSNEEIRHLRQAVCMICSSPLYPSSSFPLGFDSFDPFNFFDLKIVNS